MSETSTNGTTTFGRRLAGWKEIFKTCTLSEGRPRDAVAKWLLSIRPCVFRMTIFSGAIGGLLAAATTTGAHWGYFALALFGLVLAHAANNMINDYFDWRQGVDTEGYVRAEYTFHPILSGAVSARQLLGAILLVNVIDAAIMIYLTIQVGWPVLLFAGLGLFISVFYVAPPLRLKHHGLGELGVLIVWGPLMTAGTYYVTAGAIPTWVILASIPYALVVTTVLIGKHIDKLAADREKGIRTLPVIMGEKASLWLNQFLMAVFYALILAMVFMGVTGAWVLLALLALPRLVKVLRIYNQPKPSEKPANAPTWPLWFVSWAFYHNKLAGGLFVLGLVLNLVVPLVLNAFMA
ncbi:MAG: prenyltransferase [Fidelibacterota bacterium]|nr:MAG: prenyltransferase [Candidatus Neomarinimicrobiota bacterium]